MKEEMKMLKKSVKKSELQAETTYDYKKIEYKNSRFLDCEITEQAESLEINYLIGNYHPFTEIRSRSKQERLRILLDAASLIFLRKEYSFQMNPENLYFDENGRVYVMDRDVYRRGEPERADFLSEYKALTGYALQKKYSYEDYLEGGMDLLKKNRFLKNIILTETLEEVTKALDGEYQRISKEIKEKKLLVNKKMYQGSRIYMVISMLLLAAGAAAILYYSFIERPKTKAMLQAEIDFLKGDYIQVIDDLAGLSMQDLFYDQKYILSVAYVNTESLTGEQKINILEKIPINGDEKLMEYWIYIGRLIPLEAENIAMQKSDDELLLYAYMLEKDLTETDTEMTGEEKAAKLTELEGKISKLAEKYEVGK
ncbi:MAG: hypothetical protein HDR23_04715 [Lachnospiraceae bacterium]|nr:hypothetical protein [Lachnospiraceae bacterium]